MRTATLLNDPVDQAEIMVIGAASLIGGLAACLVRATGVNKQEAVRMAVERINLATKAANNG